MVWASPLPLMTGIQMLPILNSFSRCLNFRIDELNSSGIYNIRICRRNSKATTLTWDWETLLLWLNLSHWPSHLSQEQRLWVNNRVFRSVIKSVSLLESFTVRLHASHNRERNPTILITRWLSFFWCLTSPRTTLSVSLPCQNMEINSRTSLTIMLDIVANML